MSLSLVYYLSFFDNFLLFYFTMFKSKCLIQKLPKIKKPITLINKQEYHYKPYFANINNCSLVICLCTQTLLFISFKYLHLKFSKIFQ